MKCFDDWFVILRPVILTPYGLSGVLTGHSYKASHSVSRRILNEWCHFYPIKFQGEEDGGRDVPQDEDGLEDGLPAVVDVLVGKLFTKAPFTREQFSRGPLLNCSMVVKFYKMYHM